jgi:hypothetical protein
VQIIVRCEAMRSLLNDPPPCALSLEFLPSHFLVKKGVSRVLQNTTHSVLLFIFHMIKIPVIIVEFILTNILLLRNITLTG